MDVPKPNGMKDIVSHATKRCPHCGEEIKAAARKCKWCAEWLTDVESGASVSSTDEALRGRADSPAPGHVVSQTAPVYDGPSPPHQETQPPATSGLAIAAFLFAALGGGLGAIPALVLGARARRNIHESDGHLRGDGWAIAGQVLGGIQLAILLVIALVVLGNSEGDRAALPSPALTPDGPILISRHFSDDRGFVENISASKSGERVRVSFHLYKPAAWCTAYTETPGGGLLHEASEWDLEAGSHTIAVGGSGAAGRAWLACQPS